MHIKINVKFLFNAKNALIAPPEATGMVGGCRRHYCRVEVIQTVPKLNAENL